MCEHGYGLADRMKDGRPRCAICRRREPYRPAVRVPRIIPPRFDPARLYEEKER